MNYYASGGKKSSKRHKSRGSRKHKSSGSRKSRSGASHSMEALINKLSPYQMDNDLFSKYSPMNGNMSYYKMDDMFSNELKNVPLDEIKLDDPRLKEVLTTAQNIKSSVQNIVDPQITPDQSWLIGKYIDQPKKVDTAATLAPSAPPIDAQQVGGNLLGFGNNGDNNPYMSYVDRRNAQKMRDYDKYSRQVFEGQIKGEEGNAFNPEVLGEMGTNMTLLRDKKYGIPSQSKNAYAVLYKPYEKPKEDVKKP